MLTGQFVFENNVPMESFIIGLTGSEWGCRAPIGCSVMWHECADLGTAHF